jgi:apolipoprotein N-acyltransferase
MKHDTDSPLRDVSNSKSNWSSLPTTYFLLPTRFPRLTILVVSILWALCYPPFPLGPLTFALLAPAFLATTVLKPGRAFRIWFCCGLAYNTLMFWWIWNVMKVGPVFVVGSGVVALVAFLSLFNGLQGWGFALAWNARSPMRRRILLGAYPIAWAGLEVLRAVGEMSLPWTNLGYTLGNHPALFQSIAVWSVYGLSALMVATNLFLLRFLVNPPSGKTRSFVWLAAFAGIPIVLTLSGAYILSRADDSHAPRIDISLVQPSIPQTKKWNEGYFSEVIGKTFRTMIGPEGDLSPVRGSDLIVLAETAVPDFLRTRGELMDSLTDVATASGAPLLVGALDFVSDRRPWSEFRFYNAAFLFHPRALDTTVSNVSKNSSDPTAIFTKHTEGRASAGRVDQYSKLRLVPFSEKLPFDGVFPVINYVNLGEGDFSTGDGYRVWGKDPVPWSPSICYEVIYPSFAREARAAGARLMVNITNDGWFGRSNGPYQHANMARFRACENGMPVARAANNGISVFFDAWGRDLGRTHLMDSTVLRRSIAVPDRKTFYSRAGAVIDGFFLLALALWALLAAVPLFSRSGASQRDGGGSTLNP